MDFLTILTLIFGAFGYLALAGVFSAIACDILLEDPADPIPFAAALFWPVTLVVMIVVGLVVGGFSVGESLSKKM